MTLVEHGVPEALPDELTLSTEMRAVKVGLGRHEWWSRRGKTVWRRPDALSVLTFGLATLFVLPARQVFPPMGAVGRPALLVGLALMAIWCLGCLVPSLAPHCRGRQPMRTVILAYLYVFGIAYTLGHARNLPGIEASAADRALLATLSTAGFALVTVDGIKDRLQLDKLLRRLTVVGAFMALVGTLQSLFAFDLTQYITLPGLSLNAELIGVAQRGDQESLRRVAGTAGHYIEFGVVTAMLLPIALHYTLHARTRSERQWRWVVLVLTLSAIPFSISRSAIICLGIALLVLGAIWSLRMQANALLAGVVALAGFQAVKPGLIGTLMSLFENLGNDPNVEARQDDYPIAFEYIRQRPVFGRGPGTFVPDRYILLDNEFLGTWITKGTVGLVALLALFFVGYWVCRDIAKHTRDAETRHLAMALAASIMGALVSAFTFDALSFPTFAGTLFLLLGAIGALWRTIRANDPARADVRRLLKRNRLQRSRANRPLPRPSASIFPGSQ